MVAVPIKKYSSKEGAFPTPDDSAMAGYGDVCFHEIELEE